MTRDELATLRRGYDGIANVTMEPSASDTPDLVRWRSDACRGDGHIKAAAVWGFFGRTGMSSTGHRVSLAEQVKTEESGSLTSELIELQQARGSKPVKRVFWVDKFWFNPVEEQERDDDLFAALLRAMLIFDVLDPAEDTLRTVWCHPERLCVPREYDYVSAFMRYGFDRANRTCPLAYPDDWPDGFLTMTRPRRGSFLHRLEWLS